MQDVQVVFGVTFDEDAEEVRDDDWTEDVDATDEVFEYDAVYVLE